MNVFSWIRPATSPLPRNIVVVAAHSAIAVGVAEIYASVGSRFFLVGRSEERLLELAKQLLALGARGCDVYVADLRMRNVHEHIAEKSIEALGWVDVVMLAQGVYPTRAAVEANIDVMLDSFLLNAVSTIALMWHFGKVLTSQKSGVLAVLSSVAGDRGRWNNYHYGSAKSAVTAYASGLRAELDVHNVRVLTIKPGPVATPLSAHSSALLVSSVAKVAPSIVRAIENRKLVVYTPWFWRWILLFVKILPERIFMRLRR